MKHWMGSLIRIMGIARANDIWKCGTEMTIVYVDDVDDTMDGVHGMNMMWN